MDGDDDGDEQGDEERADARFWEAVLYLAVAGILVLVVPVLAWVAIV